MPDHAEDLRDAPGHECLDDDVTHCADVRRQVLQLNPRAVLALLYGECGDRVREAQWRHIGERVVVMAVPRASEKAVLHDRRADPALIGYVAVPEPMPGGGGHRLGSDGQVTPHGLGGTNTRMLHQHSACENPWRYTRRTRWTRQRPHQTDPKLPRTQQPADGCTASVNASWQVLNDVRAVGSLCG